MLSYLLSSVVVVVVVVVVACHMHSLSSFLPSLLSLPLSSFWFLCFVHLLSFGFSYISLVFIMALLTRLLLLPVSIRLEC